MHVEKHGAKLQDFLVRAGEVFDEIVPFMKKLLPVVAGGGVLDAAHGAVAVLRDVLVGPEPVPGEEHADAEVEKMPFGGEDGGLWQGVVAVTGAFLEARDDGALGVGAVAAVRERGEEERAAEKLREAVLIPAAAVAGPAVERRAAVALVEEIAELVGGEDPRAGGEVAARDDVEAIGIQVAVLIDDLHQVAVEADGLHGGVAFLSHSPGRMGEGEGSIRGCLSRDGGTGGPRRRGFLEKRGCGA